jgi:hypothetical protein
VRSPAGGSSDANHGPRFHCHGRFIGIGLSTARALSECGGEGRPARSEHEGAERIGAAASRQIACHAGYDNFLIEMHKLRLRDTCSSEVKASRPIQPLQVTQCGALSDRQRGAERRTTVRIRAGQNENKDTDKHTEPAWNQKDALRRTGTHSGGRLSIIRRVSGGVAHSS